MADNVYGFEGDDALEPEEVAAAIAGMRESAVTVRDITYGAMPVLILESEGDAARWAIAMLGTGTAMHAEWACVADRAADTLHCFLIASALADRDMPDLTVWFAVARDTPTSRYWLGAVAEQKSIAVRFADAALPYILPVATDALVRALSDWGMAV